MITEVKNHIRRNRRVYLYVGLAGITGYIMRGVANQHISPVNHGTASPVIHGTGESVILNNASKSLFGKSEILNTVSYFSQQRQGPPSWVVRCLETGQLYTSQHSAALNMTLSESDLSRHLNGVLDHVRGYHFERICMAA